MDPFAFTTEEEGILMAERALDELRVFLHAIDGHGGGRSAPGPSNGTPPMAFLGGDQGFALHEQLHDLEGILRMITDARLARTLIEDENERVAAGNGDGENVNLLAVIIMTAREVMTFQTYVGFDPLYDDQGSDDEDLGTQAGPSGGQIVVNRVQTDIFNLGLGDDDGTRDPPPSPLSQFSDEPDIPVPQIPSCVVCFEELLSPTGRLEAPCGHYYCSTCAINLVDTYTAQVFPPGPLRCCPAPHPPIAPRYVYRFIDHNKRVLLEEKIAEAETPYDQRIYCPQEICRKFIDPARVTPAARSTGAVPCPNVRCGASICLGCKQLVHRGVDCEKNADDMQAVRIQAQFGWGRCPGCGFVVEKVDGCNSVACSRCGRGFTYQPMPRSIN